MPIFSRFSTKLIYSNFGFYSTTYCENSENLYDLTVEKDCLEHLQVFNFTNVFFHHSKAKILNIIDTQMSNFPKWTRKMKYRVEERFRWKFLMCIICYFWNIYFKKIFFESLHHLKIFNISKNTAPLAKVFF